MLSDGRSESHCRDWVRESSLGVGEKGGTREGMVNGATRL